MLVWNINHQEKRTQDGQVKSGKVKVKCNLVQALRLCTGCTAHRGCRGIALLFLDHGTKRGWGISVTPKPLFAPGKDPVPVYRRLGGPQGRSGQVRKISSPSGFDPRIVQSVTSRYTDWATRPTRLKRLLAYLRIETGMEHEDWVLESVMMMVMMIRRCDGDCTGGCLFNEAFGSWYGRASNYGRISEKLVANNVKGSGRDLN